MSLTENGGLSAADIAAGYSCNGFGGFGNDVTITGIHTMTIITVTATKEEGHQ